MRFIPPALKQWSLERWDRIDNCVVSCGLLKPVVRKQPKSNSVFASCQVSGIWCPSSGMKWFCLCSQTSAVLFADPWLVVNRSLNLWLFTFESWGLPVWAGGALCCLSVTLFSADVRCPFPPHHGLLSERLQRGHIRAGGSAGPAGTGSLSSGTERPEWLPELGKGTGFSNHSFQPGAELREKKAHRSGWLKAWRTWSYSEGHRFTACPRRERLINLGEDRLLVH